MESTLKEHLRAATLEWMKSNDRSLSVGWPESGKRVFRIKGFESLGELIVEKTGINEFVHTWSDSLEYNPDRRWV